MISLPMQKIEKILVLHSVVYPELEDARASRWHRDALGKQLIRTERVVSKIGVRNCFLKGILSENSASNADLMDT